MPEADEFRKLTGRRIVLRLVPEVGGNTVEGRLVGTLDSADGLVVVVVPDEQPEARVTYNYQHIAEVAEPGG